MPIPAVKGSMKIESHLKLCAFLILSCAPLIFLAFVQLTELGAGSSYIPVLSWEQSAVLIVSLVFPLWLVPQLDKQVNDVDYAIEL